MSKPIYVPKGKAKEYGDYAINCPNCGAKMDGAESKTIRDISTASARTARF